MEPVAFPVELVCPQARLKLEAFSDANQQELWNSILADRENKERKGIWPGVGSFEALRVYMKECDPRDASAKEFGYVIRLADGRLAGTFHVQDLQWARRQAEVGYGLHLAFTGQGLATATVRLMEECLREQGFRKVVISAKQWNWKSWAVAERAGFALKGIFHFGGECNGCDDCSRIYEKNLECAES